MRDRPQPEGASAVHHSPETVHLRALAGHVAPRAVELRQAIHQHPELGHEEFHTTDLIVEALEEAGIAAQRREAKTGVVADLGERGRRVAFRSDLDALPIDEETGLPFASQVPGVMHACGHDAHAAIGVGVALALAELGELPGRVRLLFQPAEETFPGGAHELVAEGALEQVEAIIAFHVDPTLPAGKVGLMSGAITSSSDRLAITIEGPGGHTARPHQTVDTVYAAGRIITDLPELLERTVDARTPLSIVFGLVQGGRADNVIPTRVELSGTCRTLSRHLWDELPVRIDRLVQDIVAPTGASVTVVYERGIPPVVNDAGVVTDMELASVEALGLAGIAATTASMGAEDFARYLELIPGALVRLGAALPDRPVDLHSARFDIDERAIETGILVAMAGLMRLMRSEY